MKSRDWNPSFTRLRLETVTGDKSSRGGLPTHQGRIAGFLMLDVLGNAEHPATSKRTDERGVEVVPLVRLELTLDGF